MKIRFSTKTDVGQKRAHNEDACLADPALNLFIVCDGMGGHAAGEVASGLAAEAVHEFVGRNFSTMRRLARDGAEGRQSVRDLLARAVHEANRRVWEMGRERSECRGMGTTLTAACFIEQRVFIAHVGDSRMYLLRGDQTFPVTTDHTLVGDLIRAGRLQPGQEAPAVARNALTRAVGVYPNVDVETLELDVLPDDLWLLCSDGLHGYFDGMDVSGFVRNHTLERASDALVAHANRSGGKDNITAIVMRVEDIAETRETQKIRLTLDTLRQIPLFHYLAFNELARVLNVCRTEDVAAGRTLIREGEPGDELFIVVEGTARVHRGPTELALLEAGRHFGEMALIDNRPRSASVTTLEECLLIRIHRDDFYTVMRQDPVLAVKLLWNFIQALLTILRDQQDQLEPMLSAMAAARRNLSASPFSSAIVEEEPGGVDG